MMDNTNRIPEIDLGSLAEVGNLQQVLSKERFHAYILYGDQGSRRHEAAERIAKAFLCENKEKVPCGVCPSCKKAAIGGHPDLIRLDGDGLKADDIRAALEKMLYVPNEGVCRVYLIDNADSLNPTVQNIMLKSLEEPPERNVFLLICNSISALLQTVRSRCITLRTGYTEAAEENSSAVQTVTAFSARNRRDLMIAVTAVEKKGKSEEKRDNFEEYLRDCSALFAKKTVEALRNGNREEAKRFSAAKELTDGIVLKMNSYYINVSLWYTYFITGLCAV